MYQGLKFFNSLSFITLLSVLLRSLGLRESTGLYNFYYKSIDTFVFAYNIYIYSSLLCTLENWTEPNIVIVFIKIISKLWNSLNV